MNGYYCGTCHNGKIAFGQFTGSGSGKKDMTSCDRCHSYGQKVNFKYDFYEFQKSMPRERFGNGIDWQKAEETGKIKIVDYLEGVSIKGMKIKEFRRHHDLKDIDPDVCLLTQGMVCLGPVTRGGCGALCIKANMPCTGCFGPVDDIKDFGATIKWFFGLGYLFGSDSKQLSKTELVVLLKVDIVSSVRERVKAQLKDRSMQEIIGEQREAFEQMIKNSPVVDTGCGPVELGVDLGQALFGNLGIFVKNGDKIAFFDNLKAVYIFGRSGVRLNQFSPMGRRPEYFGVKHPRKPYVT